MHEDEQAWVLFILTKVINNEQILWMQSGSHHILKQSGEFFCLIGSGDFDQRCVLRRSIYKWNSKWWIRAEKDTTGVGNPIIKPLHESKWEVQIWDVTMGNK